MKLRLALLVLVAMAVAVLPACSGQPEPEPAELSEETVPPGVLYEWPVVPAPRSDPVPSEVPAAAESLVEETEPPAAEEELPADESQDLEGEATFDPETQTFSWTPPDGSAGVYLGICFQVTDGTFTDEECITIYVLSSNLPPDLGAIGLRSGEIGTVLAFTLQATDPDGDDLEYSARNLPPGAQFIPPTFTWVPTETGVWAGIYFSVTDGEVTVTEQMTIAVRE